MKPQRSRSFVSHLVEKAAMIVIIFAMLLGLFWSYLVFSPPSHWFHYESVDPVKEHFDIGEKIRFNSNVNWKRNIQVVEWTDTLRCDLDEDGTDEYFYSVLETSSVGVEKTGSYNTGDWHYGSLVPRENAKCYLDTSIKATIIGGVEKIQKLKEKNWFLIGDDFEEVLL